MLPLLVMGVVALVALHLWLGREVTTPPRLGPRDYWGYLGNARYLAGSGPAWVLPRFPYFAYGYPVVLVPAHLLFQDPERLYLAIRVTNAVLAASVLPLLYAFCRIVLRRGATVSLAGAAGGAVVPPLIAHAPMALAENLVLPLVVATVLACWMMLTDRPAWQRLAFGPTVVWLFATHNRFVLTLLVALAVIVAGAVAGRLPKPIALGNVALMAVLLGGVTWLRQRLVDARWVDGVETPQGPASDAVEVFTDWSRFGTYLLEMVGQGWYLVAGTLGIGLIGIAVVASRLGSDAPSTGRRWTRVRAFASDEVRLTAAFLFTSAAGVFVVSSYFFTVVWNGAEGYIAGRHNDSFTPMWVAAGVAFLVSEQSTRVVVRALLAALTAVAALAAVLLAVRDQTDWDIFLSALNVPAVSFYEVAGTAIVWVPTVVAVGAMMMLLVVVALGRNPAIILSLAAGLLGWGVSTGIAPDDTYSRWRLPEQFQRLDVHRAAVVRSQDAGTPMYYQYFLPELEAVPWDGEGKPPEPFVFAELGAVDMERFGARLILIDKGVAQFLGPDYTIGLWVIPGPELEHLRFGR